jgi:DNA-binding transcriptional ArsR family regulator
MTRPSVSEHLKVLRDAGLVSETRHGRQRLYAVEPDPLRDLLQWLAPYERYWRAKLAGLGDLLDAQQAADPQP